MTQRDERRHACESRSGAATWRSPTSFASTSPSASRASARQVSELAQLEIELLEERNPSISDQQVAEATLYLKGATLRAREASPEMLHSIHELAEDIRRQVKRDREKRRGRAAARRAASGACARREA